MDKIVLKPLFVTTKVYNKISIYKALPCNDTYIANNFPLEILASVSTFNWFYAKTATTVGPYFCYNLTISLLELRKWFRAIKMTHFRS